jgi:hypothetical protein
VGTCDGRVTSIFTNNTLRRSLRLSNLPIAALVAYLLSSPIAAADNQVGVAFLEKLSLGISASPVLTVCHGFGCA